MESQNDLTIIVEKSGLDKTKGQQLLQMFIPYFNQMAEIENKINSLNADNPNTIDVKMAREIRLALKNNRVASEKIKDDQKASILIEGRLIDNLNNIVKNTSKGLELKCEQIEKFAEIKDQERKEALKHERTEKLLPYEVDITYYDLGNMADSAFDQLLEGSKLAYNAKIDAQRKAEEERIAKEKAEADERERIRLENERLKAEATEREKELKAEREANEKKLEIERKKAELVRENEEAIRRLRSVRFEELLSLGFKYPFDDLGDMTEFTYNKMLIEHQKIFDEKTRKEKQEREKAAKAAAAEKARQDEIIKAERERREKLEAEKKEAEAKAEKERKAKAAAAKKAERAPDKAKLQAFMELLQNIEDPTVITDEGIMILHGATVHLIRAIEYLKKAIEAL